MWMHIPSTSSHSVQEEEGSISDLSWQCQALERSAWWRGKPSPSRTWSQRCSKVSWLRALCGAMPEPLTANLGAASWMASLAASRASRTASPGESAAATMPATSGARHDASSCRPARGLSSSKTSPECSRRGMTKSLEPSGFGETYASWVSRLRADCSARRKLARAMSASASSSSAWPTATIKGGDNTNSLAVKERGHGNNLVGVAMAFEASAWPTPTANDWKGSGPTLERKDGQMRGDRLDYATEQLWSMSRSSDGEKGEPNQAFGAGGTPLPAQATQWMTPRSHEVGNYQYSKGDKTRPVDTLTGQAMAIYSRLARVIVKTGKPHSKERRSLNPLFVEWLMGWPHGWTLAVWIDFACSATALCLYRQRMRFALSQLALPAAAPPAQLALFG